MTTADILNRVTTIAQAQDEHGPAATAAALRTLQEDLRETIRMETAKKQGRGNAAATLRKMLKSCEKRGRDILTYAYLDDQGRQCMLDGFRGYRLLKPLPLPELPDEFQDKKIDFGRIIDPVAAADRLPLKAPTVQEIKAHIAIVRAEKGRKHDVEWDFGPQLPNVDAQFLLDLLTVMPDAQLFAAADPSKRMVGPLYATSAAGDAILCPIRGEKANAYYDANNAGTAKLAEMFPADEIEDNTCTLEQFARVVEKITA